MHVTPASHPADAAIVAAARAACPGLRAVYRFGSAGGMFERPDSDLDVAVLVDAKLDFEDRLDLAVALSAKVNRDVDVVDMRAIPVALRIQIVVSGARLYAADANEASAYETHTFSDYAHLNEARRAILDDIRQRGRIHG